MRAIYTIPNPPRGILSLSDEAFNLQASSDRIIVVNYFDRLNGLWTLFATKWRWNEGIYDDFFRVSTELTNFYIKSFPLREQDGEKFVRLRNRLAHIANEAIENRKRVIARYHERRRRWVTQQFRQNQFASHRNERIDES